MKKRMVKRIYPKLETVTIPDSVIRIGDGALKGGESLTNIHVDEDNPELCSVDGVLFTKDTPPLICHPAGKMDSVYHIPDKVRDISEYAFEGNQWLRSVVIPDGVEYILQRAFCDCS